MPKTDIISIIQISPLFTVRDVVLDGTQLTTEYGHNTYFFNV